MTSQVEVPPLTGLIHFNSGKRRVNAQITTAADDILNFFLTFQRKLELVFVKHYAPNCLTLTLFDSNTA